MQIFNKIIIALILACSMTFAAESAQSAPNAASADSAITPVDSSVAPFDSVAQLKEEIALRDSLMAVNDEACRVEKDSLRGAVSVEQAKSANWEQSYETMKNDNATCAQALRVSLGVNEKKQEMTREEKLQASSMAGVSFLGGVGVGMLILWLITK